eukprot:tig00021441_g21554.t1
MLAHMTPDGCEGAFFGFFEAAGKGSSIVVPAVSATVAAASGELRYGMIPVLVALLVSAPLLSYVRVADGYIEARAVAAALSEGVPHRSRTPRRKARRTSEEDVNSPNGAGPAVGGEGDSPPPPEPRGMVALSELPISSSRAGGEGGGGGGATGRSTPVRGVHRRTPSGTSDREGTPAATRRSARELQMEAAASGAGQQPSSPVKSSSARALGASDSGGGSGGGFGGYGGFGGFANLPRRDSSPGLMTAASVGSDTPLIRAPSAVSQPPSPVYTVAPILPGPPTPRAGHSRRASASSTALSRPPSIPSTPRTPAVVVPPFGAAPFADPVLAS